MSIQIKDVPSTSDLNGIYYIPSKVITFPNQYTNECNQSVLTPSFFVEFSQHSNESGGKLF